jgi:eukaryotic-like serine/threonine-protein kinase
MSAIDQHPDAETLARFGRGELPESELRAVETHVGECSTCCDALYNVTDDTLMMLARNAATPGPEDLLPEPLKDHARYRIIAPLGAGGMGMVYKAEHRIMNRTVALKVITPRLVNNTTAVERFRREVRAAAKLSHVNIVTAHDAEEAGGVHFLVMEYVEGVSLDRYINRRGPMPVAAAALVIRQAALGLQHAHERGMVHRDIKPQNLMLTRQGQVKILDFGLARLARQDDADDSDDAPPPFATAASLVMGTPDYLSPEQARSSRDLDGRSDIYSLGCTFYYLLTGKVPFDGAETVMDKLIAHAKQTPTAVTTHRTDIPGELRKILERMMAKDPNKRFATPLEIAQALVPFTKPAKREAEATAVIPPVPPADATDIVVDETPETETPRPKNRRRRNAKRVAARRRTMVIGLSLFAMVALIGALIGVAWGTGLFRPGKDHSSSGVTPGTPKRVLMVVPMRGLWYADYGPVREALERTHGCQVTVSARQRGTAQLAQGSSGSPVSIERALPELRFDDYDAVVFCGHGQNELRDPAVRTSLQAFQSRGKVIAGICRGQLPLLDAGLLSGQTVPKSDYITDDEYRSGGATTDATSGGTRVKVFGRIVVVADDKSPAGFAAAIAKSMAGS